MGWTAPPPPLATLGGEGPPLAWRRPGPGAGGQGAGGDEGDGLSAAKQGQGEPVQLQNAGGLS